MEINWILQRSLRIHHYIDSKAFIANIELNESGYVYLFTLFLSKATNGGLRASRTHPAEYISRRFQIYMRKRKYHFHVEYTDSANAIHVHGAFNCINRAEFKEIYAALKKIGGDKRKVKTKSDKVFYNDYMLDIIKPSLDYGFQSRPHVFGWSNYSLKNRKRYVRKHKKSGYRISRHLNEQARNIYQQIVRGDLIETEETIAWKIANLAA